MSLISFLLNTVFEGPLYMTIYRSLFMWCGVWVSIHVRPWSRTVSVDLCVWCYSRDSLSFMPVSIHVRPWSRRASLVIIEHHHSAGLISDPMTCLISDRMSGRRSVELPDISVCYNFEEELRRLLPYMRILLVACLMIRPANR